MLCVVEAATGVLRVVEAETGVLARGRVGDRSAARAARVVFTESSEKVRWWMRRRGAHLTHRARS